MKYSTFKICAAVLFGTMTVALAVLGISDGFQSSQGEYLFIIGLLFLSSLADTLPSSWRRTSQIISTIVFSGGVVGLVWYIVHHPVPIHWRVTSANLPMPVADWRDVLIHHWEALGAWLALPLLTLPLLVTLASRKTNR